MSIALIKVHTGRRPTWLGWLLIVLLLSGTAWGGILSLYPFLTPEKPPNSGIMVVEGWIHDFALDEAVMMYRSGDYSRIVCTGIRIETGSYIQQFRSYPEMTAARLLRLGVPKEEIVVSIADDDTKDRTYQAAVALREAIIAYNIQEKDLHLVTTGPHGRRSRMLFKKALGKEYKIGVTCLEESSYNADKWYTCSEGVRAVIGEFIAYLYAKVFFHP